MLISCISNKFHSQSSIFLKAYPFSADATALDLARESCMSMKETGDVKPIEQNDWLDVELIESKIL